MGITAESGTDASGLLFERVQVLQTQLDEAPDSPLRELADELVSAVIQLYGEGLARIVETLLESGEGGARLAAALGEDQFVATLLLIHDLHPIPLEQRVQGALDSVRPYMESHGGNVELLSIQDGVARIHLRGSCSDCSASAVTLELAIKQALEEAAPDLAGLEVEGVAPQMPGLELPMAADGPGQTGFELPVIKSPTAAPAWFEVPAASELAEGEFLAATVAGAPLVIANVEGTLLAYRDVCASCGSVLHSGELTSGALACPGCGRAFFLPLAGRSMDEERLQLEPVPLLREEGDVKVALAG